MATVLLILFLIFIVRLFKRLFKPRRKRSCRREYTPEYYTPPKPGNYDTAPETDPGKKKALTALRELENQRMIIKYRIETLTAVSESECDLIERDKILAKIETLWNKLSIVDLKIAKLQNKLYQ